MTARGRFATFLLAATLAAACSNETPAPGAASAPAATAAATLELDPALATSRIQGRVRFEGKPPASSPIRMSADPYCAAANENATATTDDFVVGDDGGLGAVVVYVVEGLERYRFESATSPVIFDQRACMYEPSVFGIAVGQPLEIRNSDETLHNVHATAKNGESFNVGMPKQGMTTLRKFTAPEVFARIKCDVHPWMVAYAAVLPHPYFVVTADGGTYSLAGLPAGAYVIGAAHPLLGTQTREVIVAEAETASVEFTFTK